MSDFQTIDDENNIWLRKDRKRPRIATDGNPWGTWVCMALCGVIFLLIHATGGPDKSHALAYILYPQSIETWEGAYWGPLTSAFVHVDFFHLLFNLCWLRMFGRAMERHFGTGPFLALVGVTAFLTSTCQLAFSDNSGIGFSGVNYALFGFLWMARRKIPELETVISDMVVKFMLVWLLIAPFISKFGILPIGNAAHNSGVILGILTGAFFVLRYKRSLTLIALSLVTAALIVPIFYAPWSLRWNWNEGLNHLKAERFEEAIEHYNWVLDHDPHDDRARHNLEIALGEIARESLRTPSPPPGNR